MYFLRVARACFHKNSGESRGKGHHESSAGRSLLRRLPAGHPEKMEHLQKAVEVLDASGYEDWVAEAKRKLALAAS